MKGLRGVLVWYFYLKFIGNLFRPELSFGVTRSIESIFNKTEEKCTLLYTRVK